MRRFYEQNAEWESFSATASLALEAEEKDESNSARAVLGEIGLVLAGALSLAAAIDFVLMYLHVRPFV
jgi:cytochrome P450